MLKIFRMREKIVVLSPLSILFFLNILKTQVLVEPSSIRIRNVVLGEKIKLNSENEYFLKIINSDNKSTKYKVSIFSCKELNKKSRLSYYSNIPTSEWFIPKSTEVVVPAEGVSYVRSIFINLPKEKKYYGKKFQAYVKVEKIFPKGGMFNIEVLIPMFIDAETKPASFWDKILGIFK